MPKKRIQYLNSLSISCTLGLFEFRKKENKFENSNRKTSSQQPEDAYIGVVRWPLGLLEAVAHFAFGQCGHLEHHVADAAAEIDEDVGVGERRALHQLIDDLDARLAVHLWREALVLVELGGLLHRPVVDERQEEVEQLVRGARP